MAGRSNGSFMFFVLFFFCCFLNYEKNVTENSACFDDFIFIFRFIWLVPPLPVWAILKLIPSALLCSTGIPFPIPATGLAATQSGIIESAPWSCICIEIEWHARGCSAGHPYHLFLIRMKSFADADCFFGFFLACIHLISVCLCVCLHASLPPFGLLPILCPCQCIKMISFQIGWQFTTWKTMQMAQWWYIYLLEAQLFLDCPTVLLHL